MGRCGAWAQAVGRRWRYVKGGLWAACGAFFNKLAADFSSDSKILIWLRAAGAESSFPPKIFKAVEWGLRIVCLALMLFCNSQMLGAYVSLLKHTSALQATMAQFACCTLASGLIAFTVFGDPVNYKWFLGAGLLIGGVACLAVAQSKPLGRRQSESAVALQTAAGSPPVPENIELIIANHSGSAESSTSTLTRRSPPKI